MLRTIFLVFELTVILGLASAVFLGRQVWPLDLLSFFWTLFIAFAVFVLIVSLFFSGPAVKILAVIAVAIACLPLMRLPPAPESTEARNLRLVTANLFIGNFDPRDFVAYVVREQPDIVVTQETNTVFEAAIRSAGLLPFESSRELRLHDDLKVFSRFPIREEAQVNQTAGSPNLERHPMRLVLETPNGPLVVYAVHPDSPRRPRRWEQRNAYLDLLARAIVREPKTLPVIIAGDWNTPPWSAYFRDFFERTGYRAMQVKPWPETTRFLERFKRYFTFGAAIDHVAVSPDIALAHWEVGPDFGSNHLPVVVDLAMPQGARLASAGR